MADERRTTWWDLKWGLSMGSLRWASRGTSRHKRYIEENIKLPDYPGRQWDEQKGLEVFYTKDWKWYLWYWPVSNKRENCLDRRAHGQIDQNCYAHLSCFVFYHNTTCAVNLIFSSTLMCKQVQLAAIDRSKEMWTKTLLEVNSKHILLE